jgi:hypothetical protein
VQCDETARERQRQATTVELLVLDGVRILVRPGSDAPLRVSLASCSDSTTNWRVHGAVHLQPMTHGVASRAVREQVGDDLPQTGIIADHRAFGRLERRRLLHAALHGRRLLRAQVPRRRDRTGPRARGSVPRVRSAGRKSRPLVRAAPIARTCNA